MGERQNANIEGVFGGEIMRREIINSEDTDQPFYCSDELIEQGVVNFRPILEKAGVISQRSNNNVVISRRRSRLRSSNANCSVKTITVEDSLGRNSVILVKPEARVRIESIERLVATLNRVGDARVKKLRTNVTKVKEARAKARKRDRVICEDDTLKKKVH
jgi:hypothetical protein